MEQNKDKTKAEIKIGGMACAMYIGAVITTNKISSYREKLA
jgi:hypothetical protein